MVHVPSASIVTFEPLTVHMDVVRLENVGVRPDDAVADTAKAVGLYVRLESAPKVSDWSAFVIVNDCDTVEAALYVALPP